MSRRIARTKAIKNHNARTLRRSNLADLDGDELDSWLYEAGQLLVQLIEGAVRGIESTARPARILFRENPEALAHIDAAERAFAEMRAALLAPASSAEGSDPARLVANSVETALELDELFESVLSAIDATVITLGDLVMRAIEEGYAAHKLDSREIAAMVFPTRSALAAERRKIRQMLDT